MAASRTKRSTGSSADLQRQKRWSYVGWIPTVNGRLSFRHIGDTRHPSESIYANLDLPDGRVILAYQRRPLSDVLFPQIIHPYNDITGDFWFVLMGRSNADPIEADLITGKVAIYKSKEDWRTKADQKVRFHVGDINAQRFSLDPDRAEQVKLSFDRATEIVRSTADILLEFEIQRDGTIYCSKPSFAENALEAASVEFAQSEGLDLRRWVADQCYFFLRDASHTHQHHEPTSDTILILQDYLQDDDVEWRKRIVFSLQYAIIRFKRDDLNEQASHRALGILAYCRSFKACCDEKKKNDYSTFPSFNDDALELSLTAKANEISARLQAIANLQSKQMARASALRTIALAFFAIIVAIIAILIQPRINPEDKLTFPTLYKASTFAADNFFSFIGMGAIIVIVTWVLTHSEWTTSTRTGRALLEAAYVEKSKFVAGAFVAAGMVALGSGWLFWSAVKDAFEALREFVVLFR